MTKASIVIPCHNAEKYIEATVKSALSQTLRDIEIICIDNNCTDSTPDILATLARNDKRIKLLSEPTPGEGPARDAGRKAATGEWLYFLDSDDIMNPKLLERSISKGENAQADLVIFRTQYLDNQTGERRACPECFTTDWIERWLDAECTVFDPAQNPDRLFNSFQNWVHNKVFRATFVREHGLVFQGIRRMADILFTCRALSEAQRIALLDETLHLYRCNNAQSALYTSDSSPLDFYTAFCALKTSLLEHKTWGLYRDSYINWAEEAVAMNLYRTSSLDAFRTIIECMKREGLRELEIDSFPEEKAIAPIRHECCMMIKDHSPEEIAFHYFLLERRHMNQLETELSALRQSRTYKLEDTLLKPLKSIRKGAGR